MRLKLFHPRLQIFYIAEVTVMDVRMQLLLEISRAIWRRPRFRHLGPYAFRISGNAALALVLLRQVEPAYNLINNEKKTPLL
jgi:hypothetical protein